MATTLPADTTKADFDSGADDPKQARVEFATNADIQNSLKDALGDFAQFNNQADSGLETVGQAGGTPDDIQINLDGTSIKRGTNGIAIDAPHERKVITYLAVAADRGDLIEMDKATALSLTLTAAATLGEGWFIYVHNSGVGILTIDPDGAELIDDASTITFGKDQSAIVFCDGAAFWTVGKTPTGAILQSLSAAIGEATGTTVIPLDDDAPPVSSEGTEIWTQAITPANNSSTFEIIFNVAVASAGPSDSLIISIFRDTTCIGAQNINAGQGLTVGSQSQVMPFFIKDAPATASEITYSARIGRTSGTNAWFVATPDDDKLAGMIAKQSYVIKEISA